MRRTAVVSALASLALGAIAGTNAANAGDFRVEYLFQGADGSIPNSGLVKLGSQLYGTTDEGGDARGLIYAFAPASGVYLVAYSFTGGLDGYYPHYGPVPIGGLLYGTTYVGGAGEFGTVYGFDPTTGAETVLHAFGGGSDGANPNSGLIDVGGTLYGTTLAGGIEGVGTVFSLNPATGAEAVVYSFKGGADGVEPNSTLFALGGKLYGTTLSGGSRSCDCGTVFSLDPMTGAESVAYAFTGGNDGAGPGAGLIEVGDTLYGTTQEGGGSPACRSGCGAVYAFQPKTGVEAVVHAFAGADGADPQAALLMVNGALYGTTALGGDRNFGTIFSLDPATGKETILHSFNGRTKGVSAESALTYFRHRLYGVTVEGGSTNCRRGCGTLFSVSP